MYKYVVDGEWQIDQNAKTAPDEGGIENNYILFSDLAQLSELEKKQSASTEQPASQESTVKPTVIADEPVDLSKDPVAAAIGAMPGLVIPSVTEQEKIFANPDTVCWFSFISPEKNNPIVHTSHCIL